MAARCRSTPRFNSASRCRPLGAAADSIRHFEQMPATCSRACGSASRTGSAATWAHQQHPDLSAREIAEGSAGARGAVALWAGDAARDAGARGADAAHLAPGVGRIPDLQRTWPTWPFPGSSPRCLAFSVTSQAEMSWARCAEAPSRPNASDRGENEAQRSAIARALLANEPDAVAAMQARIAQHELRRRGISTKINRPPRYWNWTIGDCNAARRVQTSITGPKHRWRA